MTFPEILDAVNQLSDDEFIALQRHMYQKQADKTNSQTLTRLSKLSDSELWEIIHHPYGVIEHARLDELDEIRLMRPLTDEEEREIRQLIDTLDKFILRRSMAMYVLQKRGVDVMAKLKEQE